MFYVIQENLFREHHFTTLTNHLYRHGLEYEIVKYIPFVQKLPVLTTRKDVWFFGSINGGKVSEPYGWNPGIIFNENFNFDVYLKQYGDYLLNSDAKIQEVDYVPNWLEGEKFIRPTHDTKSFESNLYTSGQWNKYIEELQEVGGSFTMMKLREETKMLYASPKPDIQQEIRCWVVDGKVVTTSQYRIGRRISMQNMDNNEEVYIFCKDMLKIYQPAKAFVIDICLYNNDWRIMELGCINHCGFYDADMSKLIQSLENTFGNEYNSTNKSKVST